MPLLSLSEVAIRTGMARSSIYRLIDEGKLSATLDQRGRKALELTEVLRVFGSIKNETNQKDTQEEQSNNPVRTTRQTSEIGQDTLLSLMQELERTRAELLFKAKELDLKDRELALMQSRVDELKATHEQTTAEKNRFLEIIERQTLLLVAPKPATPARKRAPVATSKAPTKVTTKPKQVTKKAAPTRKSAQVVTPPTPAKATKPKQVAKKTTTTAKTKKKAPAKDTLAKTKSSSKR